MKNERLRVQPDNITVLGHKVNSDSPAWTGLDWSRAEARTRTKIAMPWCHPSDQTGNPDDFDCIYALYPRAEIGKRWQGKMVSDVWFEQDGPNWFVVHQYR